VFAGTVCFHYSTHLRQEHFMLVLRKMWHKLFIVGYYNYSEKENLPANQVAALPRNIHANTGTMSIHYSF
jgi:hypothetical protein